MKLKKQAQEEVRCRRCNLPLSKCPKKRWADQLCIVDNKKYDEHVIGIIDHNKIIEETKKATDEKWREKIERLKKPELTKPIK